MLVTRAPKQPNQSVPNPVLVDLQSWEDSVSLDKKHWAKPQVRSIDQSIFEHWNRDNLLEVRELVQGALELIDRSGDAPDAAAAIRAVLDQIDEELAK